MTYTWKNIVAYPVWKCKLCDNLMDREDVGRHMHINHELQCVELSHNTAYSPNYEHPNIPVTTNKE